MTRQLRAELLKLRSTRTTLALVSGMTALVVLVTLLSGLLQRAPLLAGVEQQRTTLGIGNLAAIFTALTGVLLVTSEFRYGTIRPTFLGDPRRTEVVVAKLGAAVGAGIVVGAIGEGSGFGLGCLVLAARGIPLALSSGEALRLVLGTLVASGLWAGIGVGLGLVVRSQVGAVIGLLAWVFVVEPLLFGLAPAVGRFTPSRAEDALVGIRAHELLPPLAGFAMLVAWTAAAMLVGEALTVRRDVT